MERARLSAARYKRHWSLEEAAERMNVDKATLQRWEKGKSAPQAMNLRRLCEVYEMTVWELGLEEEHAVVTQHTAALDEENDDSLLISFRKQDLTLCLMRIVWNWPSHNARYHELQMMITQELEGNNSMDEQMKRRDALRRLALLPIELFGLSTLVPVSKRSNNEEILAHCAAGVTACWYLSRSKELAFANTALSKYIPTLKEIAKSASTTQRKAAAELLAQCMLLKSFLSRKINDSNEAIFFAQQAELYGQAAEDTMLQIAALRTQAQAHSNLQRWDLALQLGGKARALLEVSRGASIPPHLGSFVYGGLAVYQSYGGHAQDAVLSLKKAQTLFFAQSPDEPAPIWISQGQASLIYYDGMMHHYLGFHKEALDSLQQINAVQGRSETIYIDALLAQITAEISRSDQPRDMELCIDLWIKGIEVARMLQSSRYYKEAIQVYAALCAAWPGEKRIKDLREYIVH